MTAEREIPVGFAKLEIEDDPKMPYVRLMVIDSRYPLPVLEIQIERGDFRNLADIMRQIVREWGD